MKKTIIIGLSLVFGLALVATVVWPGVQVSAEVLARDPADSQGLLYWPGVLASGLGSAAVLDQRMVFHPSQI